ncbi:DUF4190 domain-containing protein [Leucobacter sp. USHLN153]|uniref:DUF4190 domain-containing protein n=1 Tax=Leucobacter sp. USHLN153 TaxID=3081268 RepID=UPI0030162494
MSQPIYPEQPTTPLSDLGQSPAGTPGQAPVGAPGQAPAPQYRPAPQARPASTATTLDKTNTFALLTIIFAFIAPLAGIIFGHMGLNQIKRTGDAGRGIALTGLIISYAYFVLAALLIIAYIGFLITIFATVGSSISDFDSYNTY